MEKAGLSFREILRNGPTETSESSTKEGKCEILHLEGSLYPYSAKDWGLICQQTTLQKRIGSLGGPQVEHHYPVQEQH